MTALGVQPHPRTVRELLTEDHYRVPAYQRNYAWGEEQIRQLIDDLLDAATDATTDEYFLGNIVVSAARGTSEDPFSVVDGQQRLTTLHLLFAHLGSLDSALDAHSLSFESRPRATRSFERLGGPLDADMDPAIDAGYRIIAQYGRTKDVLRHLEYVLDKVLVVRLSLPEATDLNRYFEVMNTRGEQLQQQDIVKARLMARLPESERATFAWIWDACTRMDTYVQMSLTPADIPLRERLFGSEWAWLQAKSFNELCEARNTPTEAGHGFRASGGSLRSAIEAYGRVRGGDAEDAEESERFTSVIEFPVFLLHVLRIVEGGSPGEDETQLDDKKLVKRFQQWLEASDDRAGNVRAFALALLRCRLLFDAFVIKREFTTRTGDDGIWSLKRLVRGTSNGKPTPRYVGTFPLDRTPAGDTESVDDADASKRVRLLEAALRVTYTSPRTMHWMTALLRDVVDTPVATVDADHVLEVLRTVARAKVAEAFPDGHEFAPTGFSIPRIVFTYVDYLLADKAGQLDFQFGFRNSIEHFYPQHPEADIAQAHGVLDDPADRELLGNLALLTVRDNSKFTNSLPSVKAEYSAIVSQSPKLGEMARVALTDRRAWNSTAIKAHHDEMLDLLRSDLALGVSGRRADQPNAGFEPLAREPQEGIRQSSVVAQRDAAAPTSVPSWVFGAFDTVVEQQADLTGAAPGKTASNRNERWRLIPLHRSSVYLVLNRAAYLRGEPSFFVDIYESRTPWFDTLEGSLRTAGISDITPLTWSPGIRIRLPVDSRLSREDLLAVLGSSVAQVRAALEPE